MTMAEPYAPSHHKQSYHHEDDTFPILHQQFLLISYGRGLITHPSPTYQKAHDGVLVLIHRAHPVMLEKRSLTSNNRYKRFSFHLQC